jgi:hypothetical protein
MYSYRTSTELIFILDSYSYDDIERLFHIFQITHLIHPIYGNKSKMDKINILLKELNYSSKGPFSDSFKRDLLQYAINYFYRNEDLKRERISIYTGVRYEDLFSNKYRILANSLKRDGYIVKEREIRKVLPDEIEEARSENELFLLLEKFGFIITRGHLVQAINNHALSNWAGANSQFRTFIESLLIEISNKLFPKNDCKNASSAIIILSEKVAPPFLRSELNEIENPNCKKPFINGFWKRLHPEGSHPGLSDEQDSTFRYHISIVLAHYLLKRLEVRISI